MSSQPLTEIQKRKAVYRLWAKVYDPVYKGLFWFAHRRAALLAAEAGPKLLEAGFGTGLLIDHYPKRCEIFGIDLSRAMLRVASKKIAAENVQNVGGLCVMDAAHLAFADEEFDAVVFPFVIALVQNPEKALDEAMRVLKPGGRIVIANRFGAESGVQAKFESFIAPLVKRIGWSCDFKISRVARWAAARPGMIYDGAKFGHYFKVIMLQKARDA